VSWEEIKGQVPNPSTFKIFAGIGSRDIDEKGKQAIRKLFEMQ